MIFIIKYKLLNNLQGYPPLYNTFDNIFLRYVFRRVKDCFNRVVCGVPGSKIVIRNRVSHDGCWSFE